MAERDHKLGNMPELKLDDMAEIKLHKYPKILDQEELKDIIADDLIQDQPQPAVRFRHRCPGGKDDRTLPVWGDWSFDAKQPRFR